MDHLTQLIAGFVLLVIGGELLVRGAVGIAERLGMSTLLIGLTLVGFGTSAPELVTSVQASLAGSPGIAIGNIVGSNISNILLILGLSALVAPIAVNSSALKRDGVIVLACALLFMAVAFYLPFDRMIGVALILLLVAYITFAYTRERRLPIANHTAAYELADVYTTRHGSETTRETVRAMPGVAPFLLALAGLAIVIYGGKILVEGGVATAGALGISQTVIGLTIIAVGTSMPELITCVIAALRNHSDVAFGNILGSCIYNILGIGGATAIIAPTAIPDRITNFDNLVMVGASVLLLIFSASGFRISRGEGLALVALYVVYLVVLWPK